VTSTPLSSSSTTTVAASSTSSPSRSFDPPFTDQFKTPHGLDFEPTGDLYDVAFERVADGDALVDALSSSVGSDGTQVIEVTTDAAESHRTRDRLHERVCEEL